MSWDVDLAKEIKKRNNKEIIGAIIGTVISIPPMLKISIFDGTIFITEAYILKSVLGGFKRNLTIPITDATGITTSIEHNHKTENSDGTNGNTDTFIHKHNILSIGIENVDIEFNDGLKVGDKVLLISTQDNQEFFIIGKVERI